MKISRLFTELFQWTKRCAGKLPAYGGKNKSGLIAEKKPAYGQIKITANCCFNFGKLALTFHMTKTKLERLKTVHI